MSHRVGDVEVARRRLASQRLTGAPLATPVDVVRWLVAVQAQDYSGAKWGVGQRARNATDEAVERALSEGTILRTHLLRPTWHFVTREDIRWLLLLTAPRVRAACAYAWRRFGMDAALFKRSHNALGNALRDGKQLTRDEIRDVLERARVETRGVARMSHVLMRAELDGIVCSGARRGKQFTYALLDDRAPKAPVIDRDEALAQLTARFIASRAPATAHDLAKWAGLTVSDAKRGFEAAGVKEGGEVKSRARARMATATAHLLSVYDEYVSSYKNRSFMCAPAVAGPLKAMSNDLTNIVVVDSQVVGTWKRTLGKDPVIITISLLASVGREQQKAIATAAERYGTFFGIGHEVSIRRAR